MRINITSQKCILRVPKALQFSFLEKARSFGEEFKEIGSNDTDIEYEFSDLSLAPAFREWRPLKITHATFSEPLSPSLSRQFDLKANAVNMVKVSEFPSEHTKNFSFYKSKTTQGVKMHLNDNEVFFSEPWNEVRDAKSVRAFDRIFAEYIDRKPAILHGSGMA